MSVPAAAPAGGETGSKLAATQASRPAGSLPAVSSQRGVGLPRSHARRASGHLPGGATGPQCATRGAGAAAAQAQRRRRLAEANVASVLLLSNSVGATAAGIQPACRGACCRWMPAAAQPPTTAHTPTTPAPSHLEHSDKHVCLGVPVQPDCGVVGRWWLLLPHQHMVPVVSGGGRRRQRRQHRHQLQQAAEAGAPSRPLHCSQCAACIACTSCRQQRAGSSSPGGCTGCTWQSCSCGARQCGGACPACR
jgi:hypothetical protein